MPQSKTRVAPIDASGQSRVGVLLRDGARLMVRMLRIYLEEWDLSITHYLVLRDIAETPGANQRAVSVRINVAEPAIVLALGTLEARGYVERVRSETDRRSSVLRLTREGRTLIRSVLKKAQSLSGVATAGMSEEEAEVLRDLLARAKDNLRAELAGIDRLPKNS